MFTTAVVPLDGSQLAARALPFARRFADAETKLVVVRAHQSLDDAPTSTARYPYLPPWERTRLERKMARAHFAADLEGLARQGLHVEPYFVEGTAADAILTTARATQADLIVMSTHGHGGFGRVLYGSVADQVLRRAEIPLLLVPAACEREWAAGQLLRLLVTLDGSSLAAEALGPAREFAGTVGAELTLLAVAEPSEAIYTDALVQVQSDPVQQAAQASGYLYEAAAELRASGVSSVAVRVAVGHPAATIARVAQEVGADAIVMATHGRGGLARLFLGSVATSTLERTKVPLLRHRPAAVRSVVAEPASAARGA